MPKQNSYEKIDEFLQDIQDEIWKSENSLLSEIHDINLGFLTDYKYYGSELNTNILSLNDPGSSDWCFMFSIPDKEYKSKSYLDNLDTYPIYFMEFDMKTIQKTIR